LHLLLGAGDLIVVELNSLRAHSVGLVFSASVIKESCR